MANPKATSTLGDTEYEQHPANWWNSLTPVQQVSYNAKLAKKLQEKAPQLVRKRGKAKKTALFQNDDLRPQDDGNSLDDPSAAATPAELSESEVVDNVIQNGISEEDIESVGEEKPMDEWGFYVPNAPHRKGHPNQAAENRFDSRPLYKYADDEIGNRTVHTKMIHGFETVIGKDDFPNPERFYWNQVANNYNSTKNRPGDLDEDIVKTFNVHPIYGLPMPESVNPDFDEVLKDFKAQSPLSRDGVSDENAEAAKLPFIPSDWSVPPKRIYPLVFIEEDPAKHDRKDEDKKVFTTSRSEPYLRVQREWDELEPKMKMTAALKEMGAFDQPPTIPIASKGKEVEVEVPQVIASELIEAVDEAEKQRVKEVAEARKKIYFGAPPAAPQRSHGYDPVRDTGYQTPYQPVAPPRPPPEDNRNLHALADMAEFRGAMVPPSAFRQPQNSWAPYGPPMPPPASNPYYHAHPPASPYAGMPRAPAPALAPQPLPPSGFRELRPAPPSRPAPQPRWSYGGGYGQ
jgi:hypothetical protein